MKQLEYTIFIDMYCESILCVIDDEYMYLGVILLSYVMNIKNTKIKWINVAYLEIWVILFFFY